MVVDWSGAVLDALCGPGDVGGVSGSDPGSWAESCGASVGGTEGDRDRSVGDSISALWSVGSLLTVLPLGSTEITIAK